MNQRRRTGWWSTRTNPWALAEDHDENRMWLAWLVRLRWVAIVGQIVTLAFTVPVIDLPAMVLPAMAGLVGLLAVTNVITVRVLTDRERVPVSALFGQLLLDVVVLTAFFAGAGGAGNPFVALYLIHIAIGAVILPSREAVTLMTLVVLANIALHRVHLPLHPERHPLPPDMLMAFGQIIAVTVTVGSVGSFVLGMGSTLRRQKQRLVEARDRTAQTDRLRAVGTLAAGAAHELNTPLSTIGLRLRRVARRHGDDDTSADLAAIREQLERCTTIVDKLLVGAGDPSASGIDRRPLHTFVEDALSLWRKGAPLGATLSVDPDPVVVELPDVAFTQAFINLLENAREAQQEAGLDLPLRVRVTRDDDVGVVEIIDHGAGLPDDATRIGEPFYTTKPTGTGLGVFVARAVADGAGGGLTYHRADGTTVARWTFPESRRTP